MRKILRIRCLAALLAVLGAVFSSPPSVAQTTTLTYPHPADRVRGDYAIGLVTLALERSGRSYRLQPTQEVLTQTRAVRELEDGRVDFVWMGTSSDYERRFRPVRIPVLRGLEGYRICIINRGAQPTFSAIGGLDELRKLTMGQGPDWSDTIILEGAGFRVVTAQYENLFAMAERRRFDCFLRGVHEAPGEVAVREGTYPEIVVETDLLLVYPFASFFFVRKDNAALAEALTTGLTRAYDDGAFMAHFNAHASVRTIMGQARIEARRRFDIPNPLLTEETRAIPDRYWYGRDAAAVPAAN